MAKTWPSEELNVPFFSLLWIGFVREYKLREFALARYILRAKGASGPVEFQEHLTIDAALAKVEELRAAHFSHITICNVLTGVEIRDVEALINAREDSAQISG